MTATPDTAARTLEILTIGECLEKAEACVEAIKEARQKALAQFKTDFPHGTLANGSTIQGGRGGVLRVVPPR